MVKRIFLIIFSIIAIASIASILIPNEIYVKFRFNIFPYIFPKEPVENLIILNSDGRAFCFSTNEDKRVSGVDFIAMYLEKKEKIEIKDYAIVIHNHFAVPDFSLADLNVYHYLKNKGFEGSFCIYITGQEIIKCLKNDKKWSIKANDKQ